MTASGHSAQSRNPEPDSEQESPLRPFLRSLLFTPKDKDLSMKESGELQFLNTFEIEDCPYCGNVEYSRCGYSALGIQRYRCSGCKKTFTAITGTIFQNNRSTILDWIRYAENVLITMDFSAEPWEHRFPSSTLKYWEERLAFILELSQKNTMLKKKVWIDELYVPAGDADSPPDSDSSEQGNRYQNQLCIVVACTKDDVFCTCLGRGKATSQAIFDALWNHIEPGAALLHTGNRAHDRLIRELGLRSKVHDAKLLDAVTEPRNPLKRLSQTEGRLGLFLSDHGGSDPDHLPDVLNLFSFLSSPPFSVPEKLEILLALAMNTRKN